ncbi:Fur family transcriptional regulator [Aquihabitans sp. McL0605]|uniref:Fur family transcriptional regulator n=1 Tax=Aquihabitans sp. McL0605 TaxID=3415671 RepID=UPI003CE98E54
MSDRDRAAEILEQLRARGGRVTLARKAVVDALVSVPGHHPTAPEVVERVRAVDPDFHESTVYRTLDTLADLGVVTRIEGAGGAVVHHLPEAAHHHLVCDQCGEVTGADPRLLSSVARKVLAEHGFVLRTEAITLPGRCAACTADPSRGRDDGVHPAHHHHDH